MTEEDYILATDLTNVRGAIHMVSNIGMSEDFDRPLVMSLLTEYRDKLTSRVMEDKS